MTTTLLQPESSGTHFNPSYRDDVLNNPERWYPKMPIPDGFGREKVQGFQSLIDKVIRNILGWGNERGSIIKLEWGPDVLGWRPRPLYDCQPIEWLVDSQGERVRWTGQPTQGKRIEVEWQPYSLSNEPERWDFPEWIALWDKDGREVAAPRFVLMERAEPEEYLTSWENGRYVLLEGRMHDAKGPPPEQGFYSRCHRHLVHYDSCCLLTTGNEENCWGWYVEPNQSLLEWIAEKAWETRNDSDIQPRTSIDQKDSSNAQRRLRSYMAKQREQQQEEERAENAELESYKERQPYTLSAPLPNGFSQRPSGLYVTGERECQNLK